MFWVHLAIFTLIFITRCTQGEDNNEISSQPPINLDAKLRRALLKALTELENEENLKKEQANPENHTRHIALALDDKIVEKASASAVSFFASSEPLISSTTPAAITTTEKTTSSSKITATTTEKQLVVVQKSNGVQQKPITAFIINKSVLNPVNDSEQIVTSASSSFSSPDKYAFVKNEEQQTRSVSNNINFNSLRKQRPTTPATTVVPTEENEAKVEDVQFFSAPLVAAFTVHQDERGLPKKVEPIYKTQTTLPNKNLEEDRLKQEQAKKLQQEQLKSQIDLQEKQKTLEQQLRKLQQQQLHQDYLLRQQQLFQEQQLQLQKQRLLEEQARLQRNQQPFVPIVNPIQNQLLPSTQVRQQFRSNGSSGTFVSFEPSLTLTTPTQSTSLPLNAQHLPIKKAVDFNQPFLQPQPLPPIPVQSNPIVHPALGTLQNFRYTQSFQSLPNNNRVFRQEIGTGNVFNQPVFHQNRFLRNFDGNHLQNHYTIQQQPLVDQHLNNLLYNSGVIRGRPQEDLSIVSKVLSLNHLGGGVRDNIFGASNVQRVVPIILKKVDKKV